MVGTAVATTLESIAATKMATISPTVTRTVWAVQFTLPAVRTLVVTRVDYGTGRCWPGVSRARRRGAEARSRTQPGVTGERGESRALVSKMGRYSKPDGMLPSRVMR